VCFRFCARHKRRFQPEQARSQTVSTQATPHALGNSLQLNYCQETSDFGFKP
jgi:hypothetical protein